MNIIKGLLGVFMKLGFSKSFVLKTKDKSPYRYYLNNNKCIFIHIPKVAGTSILYALGKKEIYGRDHLPWYVYQKANPKKFQSYFKFSFVRNPFERAFSSYYYLSNGGNKKEDLQIQKIIEHFSGFNDFVINGFKNGLLRNHPLFLPQSEFVLGADQKLAVDFLGRYENINNDFKIVANHLGIRGELESLNVSEETKSEPISSECAEVLSFVYAQDISNFEY